MESHLLYIKAIWNSHPTSEDEFAGVLISLVVVGFAVGAVCTLTTLTRWFVKERARLTAAAENVDAAASSKRMNWSLAPKIDAMHLLICILGLLMFHLLASTSGHPIR